MDPSLELGEDSEPWDKLADAGITGQDIGVFHDGEGRRGVFPDLQHATPLGKVSSVLLILGTALRKPIQP